MSFKGCVGASEINHPMHRSGRRIGDPMGWLAAEGIADIVTRAARRAGLKARACDVLPDGAPRWTGHSLRRGYAEATRHAKACTTPAPAAAANAVIASANIPPTP
ncbi:hypothetical protein [Streptomyces sp. NRRL S-378]|uniref:hypothetical protein n=1 Tax=Streptomyces sp. NRRL S-378 TaxID=1463904 RepID=UPI0004CA21C1|nr:hypothetical protein [Streptomyces sp. NRRL S-378]